MIVDDEPLTRNYLKTQIPSIDPRWEFLNEAIDGQDAIEKITNSIPELIITDIKMPIMDGIELCKQIKEKGLKTKIIILSGYEEFDIAKKAITYGVKDYLLKPIIIDDLIASMDKITTEIESDIKQKNVIDAVKNIKYSSKNKADNIDNDEFISILEELIEVFDNTSKDKNYSENETIVKVKNYIHFHYYEPLSLTDISNRMNLSPSYLSSIFHKCVGESYIKFLTRVRMEEATKLLKITPPLKIYDIATKVGYISDKHFISTFKSYYKITPGEFQSNLNR